MLPLERAIQADLRALDKVAPRRSHASWGGRGTGRFVQRLTGDTRPAPVTRRFVDPEAMEFEDKRAARLPHPQDR